MKMKRILTLAAFTFLFITLIGVSACSGSKTKAIQESFTVNQTGGTFPSSDSSVVMTFAQGSVNAETKISIAPTSNLSDAPGYIPGTTYTFGPDGTVFEQPVQLTIKYDPAKMPSGLQETMLCLAKLTNGSWQPVKDNKVDTTNKTVTGSIAGFSTYGLIGSNMSVTIEPPTCFPGTEVQLTPKVQNAPPGYKLQYKWSTNGKYGELVNPDAEKGSITYKAKVDAPEKATENIKLEIYTYFSTADTPPKYTHYTWLTATTTVTMSFPTVSIRPQSGAISPSDKITFTPEVTNPPPGYKLQYRWSSDQKYGTLLGTPDEKTGSITYQAKPDAPEGATENIKLELYTQFASADATPIKTDYTWGEATATITIGIISFQYDMKQTMSGANGTVTTHVWVSHHKMKWSTGQGKDQVIYIFDYDTHIEYWYSPAGNYARKITIDQSEKSPDDPNYLSQFSQYNSYKELPDETIKGYSCKVIQFVKNGTTIKMWIWIAKNLPIRSETTSSQVTSTVDYETYTFGPIPDSEFVLPAGVKISN